MPPHPCGHCGRLVPRGKRCPCRVTQHTADYGRTYQAQRARAVAGVTTCPSCRRPITAANPITGDHRLPLARGGRHQTRRRITPLCRLCNSRKRDNR